MKLRFYNKNYLILTWRFIAKMRGMDTRVASDQMHKTLSNAVVNLGGVLLVVEYTITLYLKK